MRMVKAALLASAFLCTSVIADSVSAQGHRHHRGHHHHGARFGLFIGAPIVPYYYPRYYYAPPVYYSAPIAVAPAPTYIEQNPPAAASTHYWYYCRESAAYYPYVQQCASPWQQVLPQPPS